jgi:hypothetical protein
MIPVDGETQRLRELHELYIWQVNAAVEEGRDDLVAELADEYLEAALAELAAGRGADALAAGIEGGGPDVERPSSTPITSSAPSIDPTTAWDVVDCRPEPARWWRRRRRTGS